jgi:hypothetical protein
MTPILGLLTISSQPPVHIITMVSTDSSLDSYVLQLQNKTLGHAIGMLDIWKLTVSPEERCLLLGSLRGLMWSRLIHIGASEADSSDEVRTSTLGG